MYMLVVFFFYYHLYCWDASMVIGLRQGADMHMAQLMLLSLTISCSSKSRLVLSFWYMVSARPAGSPGQSAIKWVLLYCII